MTTPVALPSDQARGGPVEAMAIATAIAGAGDLIPRPYRNNAGAVYLAQEWAGRNDLSVFEAMQGIDIVQGKPFVSAQLRRALATRKGFEFDVKRADSQVVELQVIDCRDGRREPRGEPVIVEMADVPEKLTKKDNWQEGPADMLFAHACRRADRLHIQTAAAGIDHQLDYADDQVEEPARTTVAEITGGTGGPTGQETPAAADNPDAPSLADLRARLAELEVKEAAALKAVRETHPEVMSIDDLEDNAEARTTLADWIDQR